ncbi:MAG: GreA/GreB family elongation factor [Bacilli bacterium]|nr:GreA/GreB family elongation factor [Bacilli bacterium]
MATLIQKQVDDLKKELFKVECEIVSTTELLQSRQYEQTEGLDDCICQIVDYETWEKLLSLEKRKGEINSYLHDPVLATAQSADKVQVGSFCTCISTTGKVLNFVLVEQLITAGNYGQWHDGDTKIMYVSLDSPLGKAILGARVGDEVDYIIPNKKVLTVTVDSVDNEMYLAPKEDKKQKALGIHPAMQ